jgi:hypothetical protein
MNEIHNRQELLFIRRYSPFGITQSQIIPTIVCNVHRANMYDNEIIRKGYDTFLLLCVLYSSKISDRLIVTILSESSRKRRSPMMMMN